MGGTRDEEFQHNGGDSIANNNNFVDDGEFDDDGKPKRTGIF